MTETPKYGTAECRRCYIRLPKPAMVPVTLYGYSAGTQRTYYNKYGSQTGRSVGAGKVTSRDIWLCGPCYRKRQRARALTALAIAVSLFTIMAIGNTPSDTKNAHNPAPQLSSRLETPAHIGPSDPRRIDNSSHSQQKPIQLREVTPPSVAVSEPETAPVPGPQTTHGLTLCDRLAANPNDNDRHPQAPGVLYEMLKANGSSAIDACKNAILQYPDVLRLRYQYARAIQSISPEQAKEFLIPLVKAGYPAAFDNYGWLNIRLGGDVRVSEPYFREGARHGNADAMHSLAELIIKKRIRPQYKGEAIDLMHEAANRDHQSAIAFINEYEEKRRAKKVAEDVMLNILGGVLGGVARR